MVREEISSLTTFNTYLNVTHLKDWHSGLSSFKTINKHRIHIFKLPPEPLHGGFINADFYYADTYTMFVFCDMQKKTPGHHHVINFAHEEGTLI